MNLKIVFLYSFLIVATGSTSQAGWGDMRKAAIGTSENNCYFHGACASMEEMNEAKRQHATNDSGRDQGEERGHTGKSSCAESDRNCLKANVRFYQDACNLGGQGDATACYYVGLAGEENAYAYGGSDENGALQYLRQGCNGGVQRSCEEIKRYLTKTCINRRTQADEECYPTLEETANEAANLTGGGVHTIQPIRKHNESCDRKLLHAEKGLGCSQIGDFEASKGNFVEAEKIYKEGCDGPSNSDGCKGLVCIAYSKMNQGKEAEARAFLKTACASTCIHKIQMGVDVGGGGACDGCYDLPDSTNRFYKDKKRFSVLVANAKKEMVEKEETCKREWQRLWGPIK